MQYRRPTATESATQAVSDLLGFDVKGLELDSSTSNPYRDGQQMLTWKAGTLEAWTDLTGEKIIQLAKDSHKLEHLKETKDTKTIQGLREKAIILIRGVIAPTTLESLNLHSLEDNRRHKLFFYRFDDFDTVVGQDEFPPFIQVCLDRDGNLISFTNTLRP